MALPTALFLCLFLLALGLTLGGQPGPGPESAASAPVQAPPAPTATAPETAPSDPRQTAEARSTVGETGPTELRRTAPVERTGVDTGTTRASPSQPRPPSATRSAGAATTSPGTAGAAAPATTTGGTTPATTVAPTPGDAVAWVSLAPAGVDHPVRPQGLSGNGTVSPPQGQVIWFTGYGRVEPGQLGTAVVAGHVSYRGAPDVFAGLYRTRPGDVVRVGYRDGTVMELPVVRTEIVDKGELQYSPTVWGQNSSTRRVVLITCDDTYGYRPDGHRAANFVVVAER